MESATLIIPPPERRTTESGKEVLPQHIWDEIKTASLAGMSDTELAQKYEVLEVTIRSRRLRDPVWSEVFKVQRKSMQQSATLSAEMALSAKKVAENLANSTSDLSANNKLLANRMAAKLLSRASGASESVPLDTIADLERAVKIASIAGNWNQPQLAINQAFAFGSLVDGVEQGGIEVEEGVNDQFESEIIDVE